MHPAPICAKIPIPVTGPAVDEYCGVASVIDGLYPYRVRKSENTASLNEYELPQAIVLSDKLGARFC